MHLIALLIIQDDSEKDLIASKRNEKTSKKGDKNSENSQMIWYDKVYIKTNCIKHFKFYLKYFN